MDSQHSFLDKKEKLQIVSHEPDHCMITKLIFPLHKTYFYMTQLQTASKIYGSIWFCLTVVIKGTTYLPLIIDYIQSAFKVTYAFSLLTTF